MSKPKPQRDGFVRSKQRDLVSAWTNRAARVFGSRDEAAHWLNTPSMALNQTRPIDLLAKATGRQTVENLLIQLEHGVYP